MNRGLAPTHTDLECQIQQKLVEGQTDFYKMKYSQAFWQAPFVCRRPLSIVSTFFRWILFYGIVFGS